jgi:predicted  nucleic acid-binding Zn-ribbon protein
MVDEPDNIVLMYLRRMDEKLDRLLDDVRDLKVRMTAVEEGVAGVNRRLDRLEVRVDRIERWLELTDQPR